MAKDTSRAYKAKGKNAASAKTKRASKPRAERAPKAAKHTGVRKTRAPKAPKTPKAPKAPKRMTKKKILAALNEGILEARVNMDVDELPSIYKVDDNDTQFVPRSEANLTWGSVSDEGTTASLNPRMRGGLTEARKRKRAGERVARRLRTVGGMAGGIVLDEDDDSDAEDEDATENARLAQEEGERLATFGGRCFFLELPREIREEIYGWLLVKEQPVVLHCNWTTVQRIAGVTYDHNIVKVRNRLISGEATKYFYHHSTFYALVREAPSNWRWNDCIMDYFIGKYKDVVVEAMEKNVFVNPEDGIMHDTLKSLKSADCQLNSLTVVLSPYTIQNPAAQAQLLAVSPSASSMAYVDWFKRGSKVHRVLTWKDGLRYHELFVVLKLAAGGQEGRVVIRIDTLRLPQNFDRDRLIRGSWDVVKDRIIEAADKAKKGVELVANDVEKVTRWANSGLDWDGIRVKIAEYEMLRDRKDREEPPRLRIMREDETVEGLKGWTRERNAEKAAAEVRKQRQIRDALAKMSIGHVEEMDVDSITPQSDAPADGQQPMQDGQGTSTEQALDTSASATPAHPGPFVPIPGETMMAAALRLRKHRLAELAAAGHLPYAPDLNSAPEPEAARATAPEPAPEPVPEPAEEPEPLNSAASYTLQAVFNAGASSQAIPEFQTPAELIAALKPWATMRVGESGEVEVAAMDGINQAVGDGKIGEEEVHVEVLQEDMFVQSGGRLAAQEEELLFPHVPVTQEEYDTQMAEDEMSVDAEGELTAASGEELSFPHAVGATQMELDVHIAEDGMIVDGVEGASATADGDAMLGVLEDEMTAEFEKDLAADDDEDADSLFGDA